ncbi:MAG: Arc family DNA-binding protein [Thermoleophilia bacterium]|nr:Arc family DNA-binding protein [Thermoleophilia bacterium]
MAVSLSIKNVPDEVAIKLRERAERHRRSLQGELLAIVEEAAGTPSEMTVAELKAYVDSLGLKTRDDSLDIIRANRDAP